MSEMPENVKKGSSIKALDDLMRARRNHIVSEQHKADTSISDALQAQFDAAIAQRDDLMGKYSRAEYKIAELTQEIAEMKLYCEEYNSKLLDQAMQLVESVLVSRQYFDPENYEDPPPPLKERNDSDEGVGVGGCVGNDRAIIDLFCEFIRENRAMLWVEHGGDSQGEKPPMGWVKVIEGKEFILLPPYTFDIARRASSKAGRRATAEALFRCGVLRAGAADGRLCTSHTIRHTVRESGISSQYYAISHTIFELESK